MPPFLNILSEEESMKVKMLYSLLVILIFGGTVYLTKNKSKVIHQLEYGGIVWPESITYEVDEEGDIQIELNEDFSCYNGVWHRGTKFLFSGNNLKKIIPALPFEFAELKFKNKVEIEFEDYPPHQLHIFSVKENLTIDGLDLRNGCKLEFKDHTLYAAHCDTFGTVYFKRSVELPENAVNQE